MAGRRNAISERVVFVVGAGGELDHATAEKLATAGFTVVSVDRGEEGLKEVPDGIRREAADPADPQRPSPPSTASPRKPARGAGEHHTPDLSVDYPFEDTTWRASGSTGSTSPAPCARRWRTTRSISCFGSLCPAQDRGAGRCSRFPHYPDDSRADEVLLGPNSLERSCVHLPNGDCGDGNV